MSGEFEQHATSASTGPEWPTWLLVVAIYGGWLLLTWHYDALPWWLVLPIAAWFMAWHMSLQHEILHGHPTRRRWLNTMLAFPPLSLWLPFERYRVQHLLHHRKPWLTDPLEDPESYYLTAEAWQRRSRAMRTIMRIHNTLAGRIVFGPMRTIGVFLAAETTELVRGSRTAWRIWLLQAVGIAAVVFWTSSICHMPFWAYLALFVYPGCALSLLRSFAEHRAAAIAEHRTAIVENTPIFGLLFLHNNLHLLHHELPALPWYALPAMYRCSREVLIRQNNGLVYAGYRDVAARYLFNEHHTPPVATVAQTRADAPALTTYAAGNLLS